MLFIKPKAFVVSLDFFARWFHLPHPTFLQSYRFFSWYVRAFPLCLRHIKFIKT